MKIECACVFLFLCNLPGTGRLSAFPSLSFLLWMKDESITFWCCDFSHTPVNEKHDQKCKCFKLKVPDQSRNDMKH